METATQGMRRTPAYDGYTGAHHLREIKLAPEALVSLHWGKMGSVSGELFSHIVYGINALRCCPVQIAVDHNLPLHLTERCPRPL